MKAAAGSIVEMLHEAGSTIVTLRKTQGFSQSDLADKACVHVNTVSNLELGLSDPSTTVYSLILIALRCPGIEIRESGFAPISPLAGASVPSLPAFMLQKPRIVYEIGERVRRRRLDLGLTLRDTAGEAGIHYNTLWNLENGLVAPAISTMYRLYRTIGIDRVESFSGGIHLITRRPEKRPLRAPGD
jgi:transcriptional regulator with XRE-family HTH domain